MKPPLSPGLSQEGLFRFLLQLFTASQSLPQSQPQQPPRGIIQPDSAAGQALQAQNMIQGQFNEAAVRSMDLPISLLAQLQAAPDLQSRTQILQDTASLNTLGTIFAPQAFPATGAFDPTITFKDTLGSGPGTTADFIARTLMDPDLLLGLTIPFGRLASRSIPFENEFERLTRVSNIEFIPPRDLPVRGGLEFKQAITNLEQVTTGIKEFPDPVDGVNAFVIRSFVPKNPSKAADGVMVIMDGVPDFLLGEGPNAFQVLGEKLGRQTPYKKVPSLIDGTKIDLTAPNVFYISSIENISGSPVGSAGLLGILDLADSQGVTLVIVPQAFRNKRIKTAKLEEIYNQLGFELSSDSPHLMIRRPLPRDTAQRELEMEARQTTFKNNQTRRQAKRNFGIVGDLPEPLVLALGRHTRITQGIEGPDRTPAPLQPLPAGMFRRKRAALPAPDTPTPSASHQSTTSKDLPALPRVLFMVNPERQVISHTFGDLGAGFYATTGARDVQAGNEAVTNLMREGGFEQVTSNQPIRVYMDIRNPYISGPSVDISDEAYHSIQLFAKRHGVDMPSQLPITRGLNASMILELLVERANGDNELVTTILKSAGFDGIISDAHIPNNAATISGLPFNPENTITPNMLRETTFDKFAARRQDLTSADVTQVVVAFDESQVIPLDDAATAMRRMAERGIFTPDLLTDISVLKAVTRADVKNRLRNLVRFP